MKSRPARTCCGGGWINIFVRRFLPRYGLPEVPDTSSIGGEHEKIHCTGSQPVPDRRLGRRPCARAAAVRHHRHRGCHWRLLRCRRCDLPPDEQGQGRTWHPLLGREHWRLGLQREHDQGRRARLWRCAIGRAVQRGEGGGAIQGGRSLWRLARGVRPACRTADRPCAQGRERDADGGLQGQALQRRQPRLGPARHGGDVVAGAGHEHGGFFARVRTQA